MKRIISAQALLLVFSCIYVGAQTNDESINLPVGHVVANDQPPKAPISVDRLEEQVQAIAHAHNLSRSKKEKRIANAVRVAVVAATAYRPSSGQLLNVAIDYASAAAHAAPQFKTIIANAVAFAPSISRIDGSSGQIEAAVNASSGTRQTVRRRSEIAADDNQPATRTAKKRKKASRATRPSDGDSPTEENALDTDAIAPAHRTLPAVAEPEEDRIARVDTEPHGELVEPIAADDADRNSPESGSKHPWSAPDTSIGENASFHVKATASVRHDNNIFITKDNKVSDDIASLVPGAEFHYGQASVSHGSLSVSEEFVRYLQQKAPNAHLASANGDLGFGNDRITFSATGSYQQLYQNNPEVATLGANAIFRSNITTINTDVEVHLTPKTSVGLDLSFWRTDFENKNLSSDSSIAYPLKYYYSITPKTDIFAGLTYETSKVVGVSQQAKDLNYNIGARGNFTPKLSGQLSAGYKTRTLGQERNDGTFGFDATLNYGLTAKTSAALTASRGFSTSALGESLTDTRYSLVLSTQFSPQWQGSLSLSHFNNDYGTYYNQSFASAVPNAVQRTDKYLEGSLYATYLYTNWLTFSGSVTLRHNDSTLPQADFSNTLFSLMAGLRY